FPAFFSKTRLPCAALSCSQTAPRSAYNGAISIVHPREGENRSRMQIRAAVFRAPGVPFSIESLDLDEPRDGEVLVKVAAVGVCHSDWHLMTGATKHPLPVVPGHEGAGVVAAVGPGVSRVQPGDHVALNWAPNCGKCFYCLNDRPSLCAAYVGP